MKKYREIALTLLKKKLIYEDLEFHYFCSQSILFESWLGNLKKNEFKKVAILVKLYIGNW